MAEVVVEVGGEVEEGIGEGVVMAIKVVMEIIKVDTAITKVDMQIIKVLILNPGVLRYSTLVVLSTFCKVYVIFWLCLVPDR